MNHTNDELAYHLDEVRHAILGWAEAPADADFTPLFTRLALRLFVFQAGHNPILRRLCAARALNPAHLTDWRQIPALPTVAFKEQDVTVLSLGDRAATFHSSGTTAQLPSRHYHSPASLALYELSVSRWYRHCIGPNSPGATPTSHRPALICLTPAPEEAPHSSLAHMMGTLAAEPQWSRSDFLGRIRAGQWEVDFDRALPLLQQAAAGTSPCHLYGTAFNLVHLLDYLEDRSVTIPLPPGSRVMETGGYKGQSRQISRHELHQSIAHRLGVPPSQIFSEYGMCELGSQAYSLPGANPPVFHFPPWARAMIVNPETGREADIGQSGLIRVVDLANVASAVAVQTQDLGVRLKEGFRLLGRAPSAEARGCSLLSVSTNQAAA